MPMPLPDLTPRTYGLYSVKLAQFLQGNLLIATEPSNSICLSYVKYLLTSYEEGTFT